MVLWLLHRGVDKGVTKSGSVGVELAVIPTPSIPNWVEDEARKPEGTLSREQYQMMFQ